MNLRMTKIEARCKALGAECAEIIPRRLFNVSKNRFARITLTVDEQEFINRQQACETDIEKIITQILPGFEHRQNTLVVQKIDRPDIEKMIRKRLDEVLIQLNV